MTSTSEPRGGAGPTTAPAAPPPPDAPSAREAALREILAVLSRSRGDEGPVFEAILERAQTLCNAPMAGLVLGAPGDAALSMPAHRGVQPRTVEMFESGRMRMDADLSYAARSILEARLIAFDDMGESDLHAAGSPVVRAMVDEFGIRSVLFVPLIVGAGAIGTITLFRHDVDPFDSDEIALVQAFAAQAVIAVENARQFRELRTRLDREAATRGILEVISRSRDDEAPVFAAILEAASRLCRAPLAFLTLADATRTNVLVPAHRGTTPAFAAILDAFSEPIDRSELVAVRPVATGEVMRLADMKDTDLYRDGEPRRIQMVDVEGVRSVVGVPLLQGGLGIGCIVLYRREVAPFSDDDVALVQAFAAQAVIAIENVRQFRELQQRLEREAATREVLSVMSRSRDDEGPVFDAILDNAARLCGASVAAMTLVNEARTEFGIVALKGAFRNFAVGVSTFPLDGDFGAAEAMRRRAPVHRRSMADIANPEARRDLADDGVRTVLWVPLLQGDLAIGVVGLFRRVERPFSDAEIALVETFAAQAVIAIENVRQFREVQTRLERETATRDILHVISQSRDDERPVFEEVLRAASRLCGAESAGLLMRGEDGATLRLAALDYDDAAQAEDNDEVIARVNATPMKLDPDLHIAARAIVTGEVQHIEDLADTDAYRAGEPTRRIMVDEKGQRTALSVPLFVGDEAVGAINLHRCEQRPFSPEQIALAQTFAAQAAIAIENVRQFKALEALNAELGARVEAQVGEIERMGRLKRFLSPAVAQAITSSGSEARLSSHRALVAVLFADIRGFTAFCETAEPEETIEVLQTYHEEMGRLLQHHGAGVDHRSGDGIMAIFNDPLPCDDPAGDAVRLALAMRARMAELCARWRRLGHRLGFGVGVSLGYATVGMVGSEGRFDYTASGTAVNLGARLCDHAADGEILLSPRAAHAVDGDFATERLGDVAFKGIREPVEVFRLLDPPAA